MVLIQVKKPKDVGKVFGILIRNGKFTGLPNRKFIIQENEEKTYNAIKEQDIDIEKL